MVSFISDDFFKTCILLGQTDVGTDSSAEEVVFLKHDTDVAAQVGFVDLADINAVDLDQNVTDILQCVAVVVDTLEQNHVVAVDLIGFAGNQQRQTAGRNDLKLVLGVIPEGVDGKITVMADRPWTSQGGIVLGTAELKADMPSEETDLVIDLPAAASLTGKHAIYLKFESEQKEKSICVLNNLMFK